MKNKRKKMFNWHFWMPSYKIQVVIPSSSYCGAVRHLKDTFSYYNRPAPLFKFQYGQEDSFYNM